MAEIYQINKFSTIAALGFGHYYIVGEFIDSTDFNPYEPRGAYLEFLHENWWKGVLLYQTIRVKAILFRTHC